MFVAHARCRARGGCSGTCDKPTSMLTGPFRTQHRISHPNSPLSRAIKQPCSYGRTRDSKARLKTGAGPRSIAVFVVIICPPREHVIMRRTRIRPAIRLADRRSSAKDPSLSLAGQTASYGQQLGMPHGQGRYVR
jgi:hypothetical protein